MWKLPAIIFFAVLTSWFGAKQQRSDLEDKRQVILDVNVWGGDGAVEPGLGRGDFEIYEDGAKQDINAFSEKEEPIDVGILLDVSRTYHPNTACKSLSFTTRPSAPETRSRV